MRRRIFTPKQPSLGLRYALGIVLLLGALTTPATPSYAATLPAGFEEAVVLSGLVQPTAIRFAADGRVFVAEKRGVIKVFDSLADTTPDTFADLNVNVHNFWDRGLLGLALAPGFPADPYVYVLYTYDAAIGGSAPRWGTAGIYSDPCPSPPGATSDGCVVSGRLSRLQAAGNSMVGSEQVLIEDWCQQYPSHSVGSLEFGSDGALYVSAGDGASFNSIDYGQGGGSSGSPTPKNPCGDPPGGVGGAMTAPAAEGGALRSQDLRTSGDPVTLDGAILRVDPATGNALPNNPLAGNADPNARRIIAYGLRNPFRFTMRPNTNELWTGDVGWGDWEEINVVAHAGDAVVENFGWPCYEGPSRQAGYDGANLNVCESLYAESGAATAPFFAYHHNNRVVPNESCPTGSSSVAGLQFEFYEGGSYPAEYDGALFIADYSRDCIWVMPKGADGRPAPGLIRTFVAGAANPVNLQMGPGGDLFYPDFDGGTIRRIRYVGNTTPTSCPTGQYVAQYFNNMTLSGTAAITRCEASVNYNWGGGSPGDGVGADGFSARWLGRHNFSAGSYTFTASADDGIRVWLDGALIIDAWKDQSTTTYQTTRTVTAGEHEVKVEYYENAVDAVAEVSWQPSVQPANTPPVATITAPSTGARWKVGDAINFSGTATDQQDGALPSTALSWELILHHCPSNCHTHPLQSFAGVASGSFTTPDHEAPAYLELRLTATDSGGLTDTKSIRLDPQTVVLTFQTNPGGLTLTVNSSTSPATFTRTVIVGSRNSIAAPSPQQKGRKTYTFVSWSDGGAQAHDIVAPPTSATYTARFR
jgi:glucose/arabinose dehydrogenase